MNILQTLQQLRDDIKSWVTVNLRDLNAKIDEKTIPIDNELDSTSENPIQNKAVATEIADINKRVGNTPVKTQISNAIANQPHFSGDYNDLENAPSIAEDDSGNMVIADEAGNIIFKADEDGLHTTALTLNGESAATEKYVDDAIAEIPTPDVSGQINIHNTNETAHEDIRELINNISELVGTTAVSKQIENAIAEIPEADFTGYATETYVDNKVADLVNSAPEALNTLGELATALETHEDAYDALLETVGGKATKQDLENMKTEISESIVSETDEFHIVDESGNIVASIDANGVTTTTVTAQNVVANGIDLVDEVNSLFSEASAHNDNLDIHVTTAEKENWNNKSDFSGSYNDLTDKPDIDLTGYAEKEHTHTIDDVAELSEELRWLSEEIYNIGYPNQYISCYYDTFDRDSLTFTGFQCDYSRDGIMGAVFNNSSGIYLGIPSINEPNDSAIILSLTHLAFDSDIEFSTITKVDDQLMRAFVIFDTEDNITAGFEPISSGDVNLDGYVTKQELEAAKTELSESIVTEAGEWKVVDEAGNIIFRVDASGAHTTELTLNGENAATEKYVDDAVNSIEIPEVDFTGYATETYVDTAVADLVNSAPEALNTLGELATAIKNHEDAYDALLDTIGSKATKAELENFKTKISESIASEEFHIVDNNGNVVATIDASGINTTAVAAQNITINGVDIEELIQARVKTYIDQAILGGKW